MKDKKDQIRDLAENDLSVFIKLVQPGRVLGEVHEEVIDWWERPGRSMNQLLLLPRDHMKSALVAFRVCQRICKDPTVRVLYISSTSNLAVKQLKFIKDILTSDAVRFYWPELINADDAKREKWTETEISVDHPRRKAEVVRDSTVFAAGLTTNIVGLHCDVIVLDDVVVYDNAYTDEGRQRVAQQYSLLASIEGADAEEWVVGTRYHPKDLYNTLLTTNIELYDDDGELISSTPLFEKFERQVEDRGDGTGKFLWPRMTREDGKVFGFDRKILARKKSQYQDKTQFRAQYYNDPNDVSEANISPEFFQYFDKKYLSRRDGNWYFKNRRLNIFASIDFAYSLGKLSDSTAIVVVGVDPDYNYYVLDIDRFKTDRIGDYFTHILALHRKWDFRKLRAEVTVAQKAIVQALKLDYIRKHGLSLVIDEFRPSRAQGTKQERMTASLQPKYQNLQMWHTQDGLCQTLEEELVLQNPPHDDIKDALAAVLDICVAPSRDFGVSPIASQTHAPASRFGGI